MSKWILFVLAGCLWQAAPILAQSSNGALPIPYRHDVPKNVAHANPRGAKRWFWGTVAPTTGAQPIGLQIYESKQGLQLQLWQKNSKSFVKINGVPNLFEKPYESGARFSVELYWLDRKQKTAPVLVISELTYENLMPGVYKQIKVVAWPSGWKSKSSVQTFSDGDSNSGGDGFSAGYNDNNQLELGTLSFDNSAITTNDTYAGTESNSSQYRKRGL